MAFTAIENFDSYSIADDLNTKFGGSDWSSSWSGTAATWSIQTAPAGGQGGLAAKNTVIGSDMRRDFTSTQAGTVSVGMRTSITNPDDFLGVVLRQTTGGTARMYVRFGPTGNIEIYDHGTTSYVAIVSYSANTWYTVDIDFDNVAQPNLYRARVNQGTYSAYKTVDGGSYSDIATIRLDGSATGTRDFWIDDIKSAAPITRLAKGPLRPAAFSPGLAR